MEKLTLKINNEALKKLYGDQVIVDAKNGKPKERYWRNRLKDAAIDGCVEVVAEKQTKAKANETEKGGE